MQRKVLIMAGGRGERFWPYSRESRPKQFLQVIGDHSLLQQTVRRALRLVDSLEDVLVVTGNAYAQLVQEQLPELPLDNIILEPVGRDTAPCIGLGLVRFAAAPGDTVMFVLPADHLILDEPAFISVLNRAAETAYQQERLVTIGIRPTRPETGYGYVKFGQEIAAEPGVHSVLQFTEKPGYSRAAEFLASGDFLWNSGMFVWRLDALSRAYQTHLPELYQGLQQLIDVGESFAETLDQLSPTFPKISVDYGIMEKADGVMVLPASFGWDDLGSWPALGRVGTPDADGNITSGATVLLETKDSIIWNRNKEKLVATLGLKDIILVETEDALLVADRNKAADLKELIAALRERNLDSHL